MVSLWKNKNDGQFHKENKMIFHRKLQVYEAYFVGKDNNYNPFPLLR